MNALQKLEKELKKAASPGKAKILQKFFKTKKGEYGEGDVFLGITVPAQRELAEKYWKDLSLNDLKKLLSSKIHEHRLAALLVLVKQYKEGGSAQKDGVYKLYLSQTRHINNWDLVDLSAPNIVGEHLQKKSRKILYRLAKSKNLWKKRIAILSTFAFIKRGEATDALAISKILLADTHDLIHKATGWMLRETGKRCGEKILLGFLDQHCRTMPRTMLRYAIERLPEKIRKKYLKKQ